MSEAADVDTTRKVVGDGEGAGMTDAKRESSHRRGREAYYAGSVPVVVVVERSCRKGHGLAHDAEVEGDGVDVRSWRFESPTQTWVSRHLGNVFLHRRYI